MSKLDSNFDAHMVFDRFNLNVKLRGKLQTARKTSHCLENVKILSAMRPGIKKKSVRDNFVLKQFELKGFYCSYLCKFYSFSHT